MRKFHRSVAGSHRVLIATVATGILSLGGAIMVAVVLMNQHHAPEPPLSAPPAPSAIAKPTPAPATVKTVGPVMAASTPLSVTIPAIKVHSTLLQLGRTPTGALAVPLPGSTYNSAGWYKYSPTPGALGPAVIVGHVDSAADGPSVFYRLGGLHPGDTVRISRADGSVAVFTVTDVLRYDKSAFPTELVYGNTDRAALRLITCGGPFDSATGHYVDNIVVLASLTSATDAKITHTTLPRTEALRT